MNEERSNFFATEKVNIHRNACELDFLLILPPVSRIVC